MRDIKGDLALTPIVKNQEMCCRQKQFEDWGNAIPGLFSRGLIDKALTLGVDDDFEIRASLLLKARTLLLITGTPMVNRPIMRPSFAQFRIQSDGD